MLAKIIPVAIIVAIVAIVFGLGYVKAPPDCAYIISGVKSKPRVLIGRAGVRIPFFERLDKLLVRQISIRAHVYETTMAAHTKDRQVVENLPVKITYMYDRSKLDYIIRNVGIKNVETTLIAPNVSSTSMNFVSKYKGEELTQNRSKLEAEVKEELRNELSEYGIIIADYNIIIDIDFEDNFEENIRQKGAAEVEAQTTKNKNATLEEQAQADADAQKVEADAETYGIQVVAFFCFTVFWCIKDLIWED